MIRHNPVVDEFKRYPFLRLDEAAQRARARGLDLIDFGVGEPRERTPEFIRSALARGLAEISTYPRAGGLDELREAIARWCSWRFGVSLDPARQILPTLGSKEAIFSLAFVLAGRASKDLVVTTTPGYPVPGRGARFAGADVAELHLEEASGFTPDLDDVPESVWERAVLVWVNYPNNPTGAVAPLSLFQTLSELAHRYGFVLASDEAYSDIYFDSPPASALQSGDLTNVVVFNSLSKRSAMPGYRSGFIAGDERVIELVRSYRPAAGVAPQEFVQRASIAAWTDEDHVTEMRALYAAKRTVMIEGLGAAGLRIAGSAATFFLWVEVPAAETSETFASRLLDAGIVVAPGAYLGAGGEGFVRIALVPTLAECHRAAAILETEGARL